MAILLSPSPKQQFFDDNGDPLVGGKLTTYAAGTLNPIVTYADKDGTENPNPVILDAGGRATIYLQDGFSYKYVLTDADDVEIWTQDDISIPVASGGGGGGGGGPLRAGIQSIGNGDDEVEITFSTPVDDTTYVIAAPGFRNTVDSDPIFLDYRIKNKTVNGFTIKLNVPVDSANYRVEYTVNEAV
ncbi:MAG: hypothetical protein JNL11_17525 [Bdellovibrionaceae bacterium]|nr:hypothetical protein [Pseudobdellovibrionaceae bacterium]